MGYDRLERLLRRLRSIPLLPWQKRLLRWRIHRRYGPYVQYIEIFDTVVRWRPGIDRAYPNKTLFLVQRPDGRWFARFKFGDEMLTSGDYRLTAMRAVRLAFGR